LILIKQGLCLFISFTFYTYKNCYI
jgi:hypothetical protein